MNAPRSKPLQFWVTPEEWRVIRAAARATKARSLSDYLRRCVLQAATNGAEDVEHITAAATELVVAAVAAVGGEQ